MEENISKSLTRGGIKFEYETEKLSYQVPASQHIYTPDFVLTKASGDLMYIEAKGIWDYDDRYKHLLIRQQNPYHDIRFVFMRSKSRIRKGSKTTYADICEGRGRGMFRHVVWRYSDNGLIPSTWLKE